MNGEREPLLAGTGFCFEQDADIGRRNPTQAGDDTGDLGVTGVEIIEVGLWQRLCRRIRPDGRWFRGGRGDWRVGARGPFRRRCGSFFPRCGRVGPRGSGGRHGKDAHTARQHALQRFVDRQVRQLEQFGRGTPQQRQRGVGAD